MKGVTLTVGGAIAALVPALATGQITVLEQYGNTGLGVNTFDRPASPISGAQLVAAKSASSASVKLSYKLSNVIEGEHEKSSTLSLTASSPLNKNADETDVATLDGLVNAGWLEFAYSNFRIPVKKSAVPIDEKKRDEICAQLHERTKDKPATKAVPKSECSGEDVRSNGSATELIEYESLFRRPDESKTNWRWNLSAKFGYQTFDVVDAATAAKSKQEERPWSIGGFYSINPGDWGFAASVQYQRSFKEGANGVVCPAGTGSAVTCTTGPIGKPKEQTKKLLSLDSRRRFGSFGAGLTTTYDLEAKVWGFELPVHFVKDEKENLMAGVKVGWRDDTSAFTGTVFVGTTFGLLK